MMKNVVKTIAKIYNINYIGISSIFFKGRGDIA